MSASARAILFDFGGTLDADGVPWKDRFFRLLGEEGAPISRERFEPAFYGACDRLEGTIGEDAGFRELVGRVASGLAERLGEDPERLRRVGNRFAEDALAQLSESAALLSRLSERYRLGIVSNFYGNLGSVCREVGLAPSIGVAIDSTVVGCKKPDARIFRAALDALGAAAGEAVFVGDSPSRDMAGARALGMRHVWLRPGGAPDGGACCPEDVVIARLADLEKVAL
jgi:putative hydrolase of the HAD superfamily